MSKQQRRDILRAVQRAQNAQAGYCADYCAKNQPMAFHEIKEFQKGHQQWQSNYQQEPLEKLGEGHVTRFLSDAYCKGIVLSFFSRLVYRFCRFSFPGGFGT